MSLEFKRAQEFWHEQAQFEAQKNFELIHQHGKGPSNIFILDTSSSLGKEGFDQLKEVFCTIIDEYANHPDFDENVAVIICGRNTKFQRYYSNQYSDMKHCLDDVEYGGPSPLTAAFILSTGCLLHVHGNGYTRRFGEFHVRPRIILISDGKPTDFTAINNIDIDDSPVFESVEDKNHLLQFTKNVGNFHPIFCIPVGRNPDLILLEFLSAQSRGGKLVYHHEARQFAKYTANMEDIFEICSKKTLYNSEDSVKAEVVDEMDDVFQERDPRMPPLGSRVKRGRDWKWNYQDSNGPGTVIGHMKEGGWLNVKWDTGETYGYRYGSTLEERDKYDVQVCNEPRILENETMATGCLVKRGPDWKWGDQDGGTGSIGSVYRVKRNGTVFVRWPNGLTTENRFGHNGKYDLQICDPFSTESIEYLQDQIRKAALNCPVNDPFVDLSESSPFKVSESGNDFDHETRKSYEKPTASIPVLKISKGKYFKNDKVEDESSDIEIDGLSNSTVFTAVDQWLWKDEQGHWNPYPRKMNDKINKCYKRNPNSTVIVSMKENTYRVVMIKGVQINLTTREVFDVKSVKNTK
ncbi:uncharacterized protein LOC134247761 [Saccostrea cucullata]|uniref:uncharacterized protein LOC134247761 n=1 Tax=Saccostrea cuccullata TaxID=36930 RepID=UPI002ED05FF5